MTSSRPRRRLRGHPALRFGALALVAAAIALVALNGSPVKSSPRSDTDPRVFAGKFIATGVGVLIGSTTPADVLQLYTPACVQGDKATQLKQDMQASQQLVPRDKRVKIDGVEFGDGLDVGVTAKGYVVTLPGSKEIRLHVDGQWVSAHDQFETLGLDQSDDGAATGQLALEYVDGKLRVSSC